MSIVPTEKPLWGRQQLFPQETRVQTLARSFLPKEKSSDAVTLLWESSSHIFGYTWVSWCIYCLGMWNIRVFYADNITLSDSVVLCSHEGFGEISGADGTAGVESFLSKIWIPLSSVILLFSKTSFPSSSDFTWKEWGSFCSLYEMQKFSNLTKAMSK